MKIDRELADAIYRTDFGAFTYRAFQALNPGQRLIPNWHIETICDQIQQMVLGEARKRLVLNLPPRTLKSFIVSVALPAWLLGRVPSTRIICASYSDELAAKFSRDCRALLETPFYKRVFPQTRLNPKKAAEGEFETTRRGSRLATSVGGTLTGRGGEVLIVDDPIKANDADSEVARRAAIDWFRNTALSRLDHPAESLVCIAMQRLHVDDLSGILIEQGWPSVVIPAIAVEPTDYRVSEDEVYHRPAGQLLQPDRDDPETLGELKREIGSRIFAAQYQQNPTPADGNMIKAAWLGRYETAPERRMFRRVVLSCDPAGKAGIRNDYTAITVVGVRDKALHVLQVSRGHWTVLQMREQIIGLAGQWQVDLVIVEDTSSGMGLIQLLREVPGLNVVGRQPDADKEIRMSRQQGRFEAGRILLPTEALWLADFENELLAFPSGRYDDQVDALLLFLEWFAENERYLQPIIFCPPVLVRQANPFPWSEDLWPFERSPRVF
jgi:predicted phage terminase large subunit-like protein